MIRSVFVRALFVAIGAAAAGVFVWWRAPTESVRHERGAQSLFEPAGSLSGAAGGAERSFQADIERRLNRLEAKLADAAAERQRLTERVAALTAQLPAGRGSGEATRTTAGAPPAEAPANAAAATAPGSDDGRSAMERALVAAGLDPATVADIKRRDDGLAMQEIYLRDQATREHWLDSPRFAQEMAAIEAERTPLRNEIGDDAYDRYLFALGQTNRVRVDDVLTQSPAEEAGLQAGDFIVRYGDARLFAPGELVDQTRSGTAGEAVQLEVVRNGERITLQVPRGPLGLRVAGAQAAPDAS